MGSPLARLQAKAQEARNFTDMLVERHEPQLKKTGRKTVKWVWGILCACILFGLGFVLLYPLLFMLSMAFRVSSDIGDPTVIWIPRHFTLQNIMESIQFMDYWNSLKNTFLLCVASSLFQVISCTLVGYGLARFHFRGRSLLFGMVIFTILIPSVVTYTPTYLMYNDLRLIDTYWAMYLPAMLGVGIKSGLFIYIFRQFFINLPKELEDAAYIDGCGFLKTFMRIIIPNASVAFLTVFLFSLVFYWNDYFVTSMYFTNMKTVSTALANLGSAISMFDGYEALRLDPYLRATRMQAGCLLAITPLLLIYMFLQRYFMTGLERSGIVG